MKGLSLWSGIIALIIGLFLFIHPFTTTAMIGWIIAIIIFLSGFTSLFMYSSSVNRSLWYLLQGILSIVFGIILLSSSVMSLSSAVMTIVSVMEGMKLQVMKQFNAMGANRIEVQIEVYSSDESGNSAGVDYFPKLYSYCQGLACFFG